MLTCLNVLIVADTDNDISLVLNALHGAGYSVEQEHVHTVTDLAAALPAANWDVVISAAMGEQCSPQMVRHSLDQWDRHLPLILITDESDTQIEAISSPGGSMTCIPRGELKRLGSAIVGITSATGNLTAQLPANEPSPSYNGRAIDLSAATTAGMMVVDSSNVVLFANAAAARLLGVASADLIGRATQFTLPTDSGTEAVEIRNESGTSATIDVQASRVVWNGNESVLLTLHDATHRQQVEDHLRESFRNLAYTLSKAMASRDPYTTNHQRRVADLVVLVGARMGLSDGQLWDLRLGGLMHDIGKVAIPDEILAKPGRLTPEELQLARTHSERGYKILRGAHLPTAVPNMALKHHEALDGSGYPQQLHANALSIEDRILIPCNLVESISSFRLYRRALSREDTIARLQYGRGTKHDPEVVDCLIEVLESGQFALGSLSVH